MCPWPNNTYIHVIYRTHTLTVLYTFLCMTVYSPWQCTHVSGGHIEPPYCQPRPHLTILYTLAVRYLWMPALSPGEDPTESHPGPQHPHYPAPGVPHYRLRLRLRLLDTAPLMASGFLPCTAQQGVGPGDAGAQGVQVWLALGLNILLKQKTNLHRFSWAKWPSPRKTHYPQVETNLG